MEISLASFNELCKDKSLNDGIPCCLNNHAAEFSLVENSKSVAKISPDLTFRRDTNLVLGSLLLLPGDLREPYVRHI